MNGEFSAFFYGTLVATEVFFSACYGDERPPKAIRDLYTFTPAVLKGYCCHRVQLADYPAIALQEGHSVQGVYVTGLTDANIRKLDLYEGDEYERVKVGVQLLHKKGHKEAVGETMETFVYVFLLPQFLEKGEWDYEEFRRYKMKTWTQHQLGCKDGEYCCRRLAEKLIDLNRASDLIRL